MMVEQNNNEQDRRLQMLNTLLTTPHRNLAAAHPIHEEMCRQDPLFYSRLAAWYKENGDVRDHNELFVINLCLSSFEGHRDIGLALLRELPPYQVGRVVDFIHGKTTKKKVVTAQPRRRGRNAAPNVTTREERSGLFKNIPRSMKTEISRYLHEREEKPEWFDSVAMQARKSLKRLYALLRIKPSDRAQAILFDDTPPEDSSVAAMKKLRGLSTPAEQAKAIIDNKIPYRVASTVIKNMTPTVLLALIEVMSDQELINNMGSLRNRGVFDNPELKKVVEKRLGKAKRSKKVSALKAVEAAKASGVSEDLQEKLTDVADTQVKSKGRIKRPTALLIDKSGSMHSAIEVGKQMAALISAICEADFYCYAFDSMPYELKANGDTLADWNKAFYGIHASGSTGCGSPMVALKKAGQRVEQIMMITDEGENQTPAFLKAFTEYSEELNVKPSVFILHPERGGSRQITDKLTRAGVDVDTYDFNGDYYSLPNLIHYLTKPSRLELLMEIMSYPLPERKAG